MGIILGVMRWNLYEDYKANRGKNYGKAKNLTEYDKLYDEYTRAIVVNANKKKGVELSDDEKFDEQKVIVQQILEELCIRQHEFDDVEGDDIISYYVKNRRDNEKIVIASSDRDLTQLISDNVIVYSFTLRDFITNKNSVDKLRNNA